MRRGYQLDMQCSEGFMQSVDIIESESMPEAGNVVQRGDTWIRIIFPDGSYFHKDLVTGWTYSGDQEISEGDVY